MHKNKQETITNQVNMTINMIAKFDIYSALTIICSMEQTALHCGYKRIKYLLPRAYLLALCGFDREAVHVLRKIIDVVDLDLQHTIF